MKREREVEGYGRYFIKIKINTRMAEDSCSTNLVLVSQKHNPFKRFNMDDNLI